LLEDGNDLESEDEDEHQLCLEVRDCYEHQLGKK
jgi:hypothetical protein